MIFRKDERVFSLGATSDVMLTHDISRLWYEFYSYLLVAGFYQEGEPDVKSGIVRHMTMISDPDFGFTEACYAPQLGRMLSRGLQQRFIALMNHKDLTAEEQDLLGDMNGLFAHEYATYKKLSAKKIYGVAEKRDLDEAYKAIAHHVAMTFGQQDYLSEAEVPRLYISMFGNIHLCADDKVLVTAPLMPYGSIAETGHRVTALWAFLSTQLDTLTAFEVPGEVLGDMLGSYAFLANTQDWQKTISVPRLANALRIRMISAIDQHPRHIASYFYQKFLYGHVGNIDISRSALLSILLDHMVKKMGQTRHDHMFASGSLYNRLVTSQRLHDKEPRRNYMLDYALEALDEIPEETEESDELEDSIDDSQPKAEASKEQTVRDPSTATGGYDPSAPTPPGPAAETEDEEDTIGLISFDKTGEGVDEDLYRSAVVALNDRLKNDDTLKVTADVKDALNYWVNGYLYLTAISATKEQIASLGLQSYLKNVSN